MLIALVDALVLQRPWNPDRGPFVPKLARDVVRIGLLVAAALYAATVILNQPVGPLLVSSTVLSAVIGLAMQDTLKNIFSGMALDLGASDIETPGRTLRSARACSNTCLM